MIKDVFVVIQAEYIDDGFEKDEDEDEDAEMTEDDEASSKENSDVDGERMDADEEEEEEQPQLNPKARLASKKASETFGPLLRSKGFVWLATRPMLYGELSQAGVMLTLQGGQRWRCEVPEEEWPQDEKTIAAIKKDFEGRWGDRRQEIVLIGTEMRKGGEARLRAALEACLLDDEEWAAWERIMDGGGSKGKGKGKKLKTMEQKQKALEEMFEDGFEDWLDEEDMEHDHDHDH